MPRDGTGSYALPNPDVATGTPISSADENATRDDIATALTGSLARDGQGGMTGNLPMGGNRITGLGAPGANDEAARRRDVGLQWIESVTVSGTPTFIEFALPTGFAEFEFRMNDLGSTVAGATLGFQLSNDGGSSYISGASDYLTGWYGADTGGFSAAAAQALGGLSFGAQLNTAQFRGVLRLTPATAGGIVTRYSCEHVGITNLPALIAATFFGTCQNTTARPNRLRFLFNGATFTTSGTIVMMGVRP